MGWKERDIGIIYAIVRHTEDRRGFGVDGWAELKSVRSGIRDASDLWVRFRRDLNFRRNLRQPSFCSYKSLLLPNLVQ
jgi:hypothetical protein